MKILSTCIALLLSASSLSAYYYQSGYYNRNGNDKSETYTWVNEESCENCGRGGYQDFWYQGSLNPLSLIMAYGSYSSYTYPTLPNSDNAVAEKVRVRLAQSTTLPGAGKNIDVSVTNGKVTLSGTVSNKAEKSMAASTARQVPGVTTVINNLVIQR